MPELPEVETVVRELQKTVAGEKIISARVLTPKIRIAVPENLAAKLKGREILAVTRRAKYILFHLSNHHLLVIHLGMSGRIHISGCDEKPEKKKHDHFSFCLAGGRQVTFNDPRRFGLIAYIADKEMDTHRLFAHLGPEPLSAKFSPALLGDLMRKRRVPVKIALMDQKLVVGVGNIYACEAVFESGIDPRKSADALDNQQIASLTAAIKKVLKAAIRAGGSTLRDYRKTNGDLGYFQHSFSVYDKEGKPCAGCTCRTEKTGGVQRITQGGRSTFYCPRKQV